MQCNWYVNRVVLFVIITNLLSASLSRAQIPLHGHVINKHTKQGIANASIKLKNSKHFFETDYKGYFYIPAENTNKNKVAESNYWVATYPNLNWYFNNDVGIEVYSISGKLVYKSYQKAKVGVISTNKWQYGVYIIKVDQPNSSIVYKVLKSTNTISISKHIEHLISSKNYTDTLIVRKNGFYDETIPISISEGHVYGLVNIELSELAMPDKPYFMVLKNHKAFNMLSSTPLKLHLGEVESIKAMINKNTGDVYYINLNQFKIHYDFAQAHLDYNLPHNLFRIQQYNNVDERYLYPLTINYFKELNIYTFEFFSGDGAICSDVNFCYQRILETSYFADKLYFYATNDSWLNCTDIPFITPNELFEGQNYQALNTAETYGYLRKTNIDDLNKTDLGKHDILLVNGLPFDIPVLAGIITTEFQTPLSHINVLSHNRATPNMALRDGFENPVLNKLLNELVYLNVTLDSFYIRKAEINEARLFWDSKEPQSPIVLEPDYETKELINLDYANKMFVKIIGGKAANFAEIINAFSMHGYDAPVPENYFAIPFYYYHNHITQYGIDNYIDSILSLSAFYEQTELRKRLLKSIRDTIKTAPLDDAFISMVTQKCSSDNRFDAYRFRSSTNAEDIEGFNGAGLYDSNTGNVNDAEKPIDEAIKKTWASLWNYAAFDEREYFKIDHNSCAMGVLVHRSFPDEDANGVILSKNPYNGNHGYIVNVQHAEYSIVDPEPGIIHDQIVVYTFSITREYEYTIEYFSCSNVPELNNQHVMTDYELYKLADYIGIIKKYFYNYPYPSHEAYNDYALDIEFKLDSKIEPRKIYIKQVRPY